MHAREELNLRNSLDSAEKLLREGNLAMVAFYLTEAQFHMVRLHDYTERLRRQAGEAVRAQRTVDKSKGRVEKVLHTLRTRV